MTAERDDGGPHGDGLIVVYRCAFTCYAPNGMAPPVAPPLTVKTHGGDVRERASVLEGAVGRYLEPVLQDAVAGPLRVRINLDHMRGEVRSGMGWAEDASFTITEHPPEYLPGASYHVDETEEG